MAMVIILVLSTGCGVIVDWIPFCAISRKVPAPSRTTMSKKISYKFPDIVRASARKYEGHEPIDARAYGAGDTECDEIGLKFTPTGSRLVDYRAEKHIVDNIPDAVDDVRYSLVLQADLKNIGNESLRIRVDIEALRHIIDDVSDSFFRSDITPVLKDVS